MKGRNDFKANLFQQREVVRVKIGRTESLKTKALKVVDISDNVGQYKCHPQNNIIPFLCREWRAIFSSSLLCQ